MSESMFGELSVTGKDQVWQGIKFDRLAVSNTGYLMLMSVLADTGLIKGLRSVLNTEGMKVTIRASGLKVKQASQDDWQFRSPGEVAKIDGGYVVDTHRVGYGMAHAMIYTRRPEFMPAITDEHLWAQLSHSRFTTPMMRHWVPWIRAELGRRDLLAEANCVNCACGVLGATTASLDEIVGDGIRQGSLTLSRPLTLVG